jgi:serine/threonine protein kinase
MLQGAKSRSGGRKGPANPPGVPAAFDSAVTVRWTSKRRLSRPSRTISRILPQLGEGTYGIVYRARRRETGGTFALKIMKNSEFDPAPRAYRHRSMHTTA